MVVIRHAARLAARRCLYLALGVGAFVLGSSLLPTPMEYDDHKALPEDSQSRAEVLVERYGCWSGEAPPDVDMPGHVVWQHADGRTVYSERLVGPALDTLFGDGDLAGRPIAFCR